MKNLIASLTLISGMIVGGAASAQGTSYYYGGGLDVTFGISDPDGLPNSEATIGGVTALIGMEMPLSGPFFYGAEASFTYNVAQEWTYANGFCYNAGDGPYACELDYSARIVGVLGYDMGTYDIIGSLGVGYVTGTYDFNSGTGMNYGPSVGLGARYALSNGLQLRGEFIYDYLMFGGVAQYDTIWEAATLRFSLTKDF